MNKDARFYQNSVNFGDIGEYDNDVIQGARMAIWLYIDKERTIKAACKISSKKKCAPASRIEKCLRLAIPQDIIHSRRGCKMPDAIKQNVRQEKIADYHMSKHFKTI